MLRWSQLPISVLTSAAIVLAAASALYGGLWMYAVRHDLPPVEIGYEPVPGFFPHCQKIQSIYPGSPAQRADLRPGDCLLAVNGQNVITTYVLDEAWWNAKPGDPVTLTVERPGASGPLELHAQFRARLSQSTEGLAKASATEVLGSYPAPFLLVGIAVLFLRREDINAWLLALMLCAFIGAAPLPTVFYSLPSWVRPFMTVYRAAFQGLLGAIFYIFFAVFPAPSPLERRAPWLKWVALGMSASVILPGLERGAMTPPLFLAHWIGIVGARAYLLSYVYGFLFLGVVALVGNAANSSNPVVSRKSRLILWGTVLGVFPVVAERAAMDFAGFQPPFWFDTAVILDLAIFPLTFAYVVVKHRVMEIPLLLKRSARYILVQKGFILLLFVMASVMIAAFTNVFSRFFSGDSKAGMAVSAAFGIVLVWASAPLIRRGTDRIDRAFFRSAYDARRILQDLADKARTVSDRHHLAALLERHIQDALQPKFLTGFLEAPDGHLAAEFGPVPAQLASLDPAGPLMKTLAARGKPWEVPPSPLLFSPAAALALPGPGGPWESEPPALPQVSALSAWSPLAPECLVPILGRENRLMGLLALGERRSEEPYSAEDMRLLEAAASQVGVALESIRLAESIAERMESERRAAHEVEIAREVQSRLFPQKMPPLQTLDYAGGCVQARVVGGDYYDFLDLGPGRLGIVLADIAGKGIAGALLMANLQANLRSQYALALEDLPRLLQSVNRLFRENTPDDRFATLFFADYADSGRRLRYVNCGHNPPLLLRANGKLDRLVATATVLGIFQDWQCEVVETSLAPGDLLVMYTDGVSEAPDAAGQEFGEKRLLAAMRSSNSTPATDLLSSLSSAVQQYSNGIQADDLTLVVARSR
ncbi:MAG TPA: SpoIIE family protein phosphatase [Candidatus Acidoferrales bacterium]|nr:SpoIIE family protein phosphatase [Candidatus Acidoferrales bacterium]